VLAEAMNEDVDLIVLRLFENTSYQVQTMSPTRRLRRWIKSAELLVGMAEAAYTPD